MTICHLSQEEINRLTMYGIPINHDQHRHLDLAEALGLIKSDLAREFTHELVSRPAIVDQESNNRHWVLTPSGGVKVQQLVRTGNGY